jgi:hypothetical protein
MSLFPWDQAQHPTTPRRHTQVSTPELFPGEAILREMATQAGWSPSTGNGWAAIFVSPHNENATHRTYASFFLEGVAPAFLLVETLEGDPERGPLGLQVWVSTRGGRVPAPEEAMGLLDREGVVCRVGDLMPEDLAVEG